MHPSRKSWGSLHPSAIDRRKDYVQTDEEPPPGTGLAIAEHEETSVARLTNPDSSMFSERNSETLNARDNDDFGAVWQDDYDTWGGEAGELAGTPA